eukprot:TCALIF_06215-PA protein Name:"Protein of unknown function" AED:0.09 eAED:0.09 QI:65/1/0/1/1/1/2/0/111
MNDNMPVLNTLGVEVHDMALEDRKQKAVEILMRWKEFVEQGPSSELRIVLDHIEKFNGEAPIKMKRNIFPHVDRKRKRERAPSIFPHIVKKRQSPLRLSPTTTSFEELIKE